MWRVRPSAVSAILYSLLAVRNVSAQAPVATAGQTPSFEVTSVKPNKSDAVSSVGFQASGRFVATRASVRELIRIAYGMAGVLEPSRVIGGPGWIDVDRFDVVGKTADGDPQPLMLLMLRSLLADRFKLSLHSEIRELPIYALVMARSDRRLGPRLRAVADCTPDSQARDTAPLPKSATCGGRSGLGHVEFGGLPLSMAIERSAVAREVRRVIVDRTGLAGAFEGSVDWTPSELATPNANQPDPFSAPPLSEGASIFTALQEQLGLKLVPSTGEVEVFVIDRIEHPDPD